MSAGKLQTRVAFHRLEVAADGYGNETSGFAATPFLTRWGWWRPTRGKEMIEAGRPQSSVTGTLRLRTDSAARAITAADKAVLGGEDYQIRAVFEIDQSGRWLELSMERGVAV